MEPGIRRRLGRNPDMGRIRFGGETLDELFARIDAEFRARLRFYEGGVIADTRWYGWRLDPANLELVLVDSTGWRTYALPLTRCNQSAQVLDWLVQVSGKAWREHDIEKVTVGLLRALDDIFELQASLCSFGAHKTMTDQQIRDRVATFVQKFHEGEQP